jgi:hypothetical protein
MELIARHPPGGVVHDDVGSLEALGATRGFARKGGVVA